GKPEFVVNFFEFIAEEVREHLATLGFRSLDEAIGHVEVLDTAEAVEHWKASGLDLAPVLHLPALVPGSARRQVTAQDHGLQKSLDHELIARSRDALDSGAQVSVAMPVRNVNRSVGTMLGHEVTKAYGPQGLPPGTIDVTLTGSAGQSLGAFLPRGITLRLFGDANDYVAKGLSGGRVVVRPDRASPFVPAKNVVAGNVVGYGATSGELFVSGLVGERFCVRNSGATAVVEGVGDHGCEYMTGGVVLVLGSTGRNFGAGMSGGVAYVLDFDPLRLNPQARASGEIVPTALDDRDAEVVRGLLERHLEETESSVAWRVLQELEEWLPRFSKLTHRDYAQVVAIRTAAADEGADPDGDTVWTSILNVMEGARG
ncbi:MAG TPA: glutamate synthase subunit alpha, partial [Actinomycetales bacterium]|nr:glutamate synthase subunit alpha [Actinomycetales bacterium]